MMVPPMMMNRAQSRRAWPYICPTVSGRIGITPDRGGKGMRAPLVELAMRPCTWEACMSSIHDEKNGRCKASDLPAT